MLYIPYNPYKIGETKSVLTIELMKVIVDIILNKFNIFNSICVWRIMVNFENGTIFVLKIFLRLWILSFLLYGYEVI